jgi:hypothetical protein
MRQALAIVFISIHLLSNTELSQVARIPKLISHYFQHHRQAPEINFMDFLAMHYGGDDGTSADDDIDNQLPCHNNAYSRCLFNVYSPMVQDVFFFNGLSYSNVEHNDVILNSIYSEYVLLLLKPPRIA